MSSHRFIERLAMTQRARILDIEPITHDVKRYTLAHPEGITFKPGQAADVAIDKQAWRDKTRPFTFTCLPDADHLEFTIKSYRDHDGVTCQLDKLEPGDALLLGEVFGAITYRGPGTFIAGGAGVTPFIAILRDLFHGGDLAGNQLLFSNKTARDVILEAEFRKMLGKDAIFTLTREDNAAYERGRIDADFLKKHRLNPRQPVYLCGPPSLVETLTKTLKHLGVETDSVVIEE